MQESKHQGKNHSSPEEDLKKTKKKTQKIIKGLVLLFIAVVCFIITISLGGLIGGFAGLATIVFLAFGLAALIAGALGK